MRVTDPHSFMDLTQGKIDHIELQIDVDFSSLNLGVLATYHLEKPVSGSLYLDSRDLSIDYLAANGRELAWQLDRDDPILGQRLHLQDLENVATFSIRYTTASQASALQWLTPLQTAGGRAPFLYSQCFPIHARSLFPCQDSPSVRFTYQVQMRVPQSVTAVMAAKHVATEDEGDTRRFSFTMPQSVPAYLFAFAVGDLQFHPIGPRTGVYAEPELIEAAAWEFAENERKLAEAEKLLGPYLWDRYDLLIMPPSFPYGGMENPRLTFLSPALITGQRSRTHVISHEMAHAWTGNLITNATWEDFWLNEGWTTYAESRITEAIEGRELSQLGLYEKRTLMYEDMDRFGLDAPETCLKYPLNGQDPDTVFSTIPYIKGHFFVAALEEAVGRAEFDRFMASYISTHQFSSLTTEQFTTFLKAHLPEAAGRVDIQQWLYQPGFPEDVPDPSSKLYDQVARQLAAYQEGRLPTPEDVAGWKRDQVNLFLRLQQKQIPVSDVGHFEQLFDLQESQDAGLLTSFFLLAIRSGYTPVLPRVKQFVRSVGSFGSIIAIFRCLSEAEWTQGKVRALLDQNRAYHHPITLKRIEQILADSGL